MPRLRYLTLVLVTVSLFAGCQASTAVPTSRAPGLQVTIQVLPSPTPTPRALVSLPGESSIPSTSDQVPRITAQELKALQDSGQNVAIVDTRGIEFYEVKHILGAISMPYNLVEQRYSELSPEAKIVFYCT